MLAALDADANIGTVADFRRSPCAALRAAGERWTGMAPWVACRRALRG